MAQSFIGKPISLVSHSDVRYRGILAGIDPAASTIQLSNVYSMGTESRRPPAEFIPPVQDPYQYIIFRASEVKDLAVDEPAVPTHRSVHDDPAVLAAPPPQPHAPAQQAYPHPVPVQQPYQAPPVPIQQPQPQPQPQAPPQPQPQHQAPPPRPQQQQQQQQQPPARRTANANANSVHTAAASLETVERALGDLRVSNTRGRGRGARPPRHAAPHTQAHQLTVPTTDFDFASMNAKFDKAALGTRDAAPVPATDSTTQTQVNGTSDASTGDTPSQGAGVAAAAGSAAYDPSKSFFDSLSPTPMPASASAAAASGGAGAAGAGAGVPGARGRRGGRDGRSRREEERERNVATFGEPGGAHAHAHVGAGMWGGAQGYARRGGARGGRRGGGVVGVGVGVGARV